MCLNSILCLKRLNEKRALSLLWSRRWLNPGPGLLKTVRGFAISFSGSRTENSCGFVARCCRMSPLLEENTSRAVPCVTREERLENQPLQKYVRKMGHLLCARKRAGCAPCVSMRHALVSSTLAVVAGPG